MRRSVSALAVIVLVSGACAAFGSTHTDTKKTHVKTQAEQESTHVSKTDHTVPATPTAKEGTQLAKNDHAVPATPTGNVATHASRTDHTVPATPTLKDVPHVKAADGYDPAAPTVLESTKANACPGGGAPMPLHVKRSQAARTDFMRNSGYPDGRKGYTVTYFTPLECGGSDTPDNMQWQPVDYTAAGKAASHP